MTEKSHPAAGGARALATVCGRYRWAVLVLWLVGVLGIALYARAEGPRTSADVAVPGSDSARALALAGETVPGGKLNDTASVVLHSRRGTLDDPPAHDQVTAMTAELTKLPGLVIVADPFSPVGPLVLGTQPISADRRTGITSVVLKSSALEPDRDAARRIIDIARAYDGPDLQVEVAGPGATALNATTVSPGPLLIAALGAVLFLGITLRSRFAVALCAAAVGAGTISAVGVTVVLSHLLTTTPLALLLAGLIAAGTSLGGAIVVVHRAQESLRAGARPVDAASEASGRSGTAVAVGSLAVAAAMAVVVQLDLSSFDAIAVGAVAAGVVTALIMITLLPALLSLGGPHLLGWVERHHVETTGAGLRQRPGVRAWWARWMERRPAHAAVIGSLVLVTFAAMAVPIDLGGADDGVDPTSMSTRRAYDLLSAEFFPGLNGPMLALLDRRGSQVTAAEAVAVLAKTPGVEDAALGAENPERGLAMIRILPEAAPRTPEAVDLLHRLRDQVTPTLVGDTTARIYIGGATAISTDIAADFQGATTKLFAVVLVVFALFGFLLLGSALPAAALAATAVLSALAAAGQIALLFQTDAFARSIGLTSGPVEPSFLALILIAVISLSPGLNLNLLVGLSEHRDPPALTTRRARRADKGPIATGHAEIGHVVLTMNLVMLFIFAAVAAQPSRLMKVIGVGLATGVTLDAFVLRATVLPALLHLLRRRGRRDGAVRRAPEAPTRALAASAASATPSMTTAAQTAPVRGARRPSLGARAMEAHAAPPPRSVPETERG
ncbi:MMPL family transporter [Parafrankia sp. FMc2]|uniref:MMPL family transporter n=1 Tax=Parafrankia sp. FMc2 TaxID=3233196 RepID=UPI0034D4ABEF